MRNHTAYVICFVQELIRSSNTDCQVVSVSRDWLCHPPGSPGAKGPSQLAILRTHLEQGACRRNASFWRGSEGPRTLVRGSLASRTLWGGSVPVPCQGMGSLDAKPITGGHAAHCASRSFERTGPTPDLCVEVNSADSSYGKSLKYSTLSYGSWSLCVPTSTSFWEPGQTSAQNERKA